MSDAFILETEHLKIIYSEIIDGFSFYSNSNLFIKHLDEFESTEIIRRKQTCFQKQIFEKTPTEKERLQQLIESGEWSEAKNEEIIQLRYIISDNEKNVVKLITQQQEQIRKIIENDKKKLDLLLAEKRAILGITAEQVAEREGFNYLIYLSLYNNNREKLFKTYETFEDTTIEELTDYSNAINETFKRLSESVIKKVSVLPFFINVFAFSQEDIQSFLKVPISKLTSFQTLLFSLGRRNLNILSQSEGNPPELLDDVKIDDIVNWYDQQYSIILGKRKANNKV